MIKFGTGGFRGIIGDDFTKHNVELIAQALSDHIKNINSKKPVVIGYDYRFMSDYSAKYFGSVLAGNGIKSYLFDKALPTPAVMTSTMNMDNDFGIMITASHNPYIYNGVKLFTQKGKDADLTVTRQIENLIENVKEIKTLDFDQGVKTNLIEYYDGLNPYVKKIENLIDNKIKNSKLKIAFDCMNGVTGITMDYFASRFNLDITICNREHDAFFRFIPPAPNEKTLIDFKNFIVKNKYDIGFASDADGDRLGVIDSDGVFYSNNMIMAIIYYYLIKYKNQQGDIVKNNSTSYILDNLAKKFGFKCIEVPVGFKYISSALIENDALLGGESSGGLTVRGYIFGKDGTFSTMMLIEALSVSGKTLKEMASIVKDFAEYDSVFIEDSTRVKDKQHIIDVLTKNNPQFPKTIKYINTDDGFKYFFNDGTWANIRFSGTEPLLRIFVETYNHNEANEIISIIHAFIRENDK